jgi:hypothetical protein
MASTVTREDSAPVTGTEAARPGISTRPPGPRDAPVVEEPLPSELLADLDDESLVLSTDYIGSDRRARGLWGRLKRATFAQRRSLLRLEGLVAALVVIVVVASVVLVGSTSPSRGGTADAADRGAVRASAAPPATTPATTPETTPATTAPVPSTTTPVTTAPAPVVAPATPPAPPATTPPVSTAALTPSQLGAQALALVRYPWQSIPGYSIQFQPISAAPSPSFYGNTTFTWGQAGGTSVLYVYPGETAERLAGITAFEIAHEVDAAAVQPQGGEGQIENILGIHPASWAPNCDCAEQGFLSGWYAAAFSNYWSPGVGDWSQIAPMPTGATLAAIQPWLNPSIP